MDEVFVKNFFMIGTLQPEESGCFIPGVVGEAPDLWECEPEVWKWKPITPCKLIGASLVLLCAPTNEVEAYACVCRGTDIDPKHNFAAMKKDFLFYAQRDSYTECAGVSDLISWQMLPAGNYFPVTNDPIYVKVGVVNLFKDRKIDFDVIVNLYFKVST